MAKKRLTKAEVVEVLDLIEERFPNAKAELHFENPFELTIATILSAQCTDVRVNKTTRILFPKYPTPKALAEADPAEVEEIIRPCGFYRTKTKNIMGTARILHEEYDDQVPNSRKELEALPGVGRKTANVVLSNAFGQPAIAVDTHVFRVSNRLGMSKTDNVEDCERELQRVIPKERWSKAHHLLIFQGRRVCKARKPLCEECNVRSLCLYEEKTI